MENNASALIVVRSPRIREGVRALLKSIPYLEIIDQADDGPSALKMVADHHPALVLLDSNLPDEEAWAVLKQTKALWPQTQCLVLATSAEQQWIAKAAGADEVLLTGFPASKFFTVIDGLLSRQQV